LDQWSSRAHEPNLKDATVKRYHYDSHEQLRTHLHLFLDPTTMPAGQTHHRTYDRPALLNGICQMRKLRPRFSKVTFAP
jgi:hypothetical protein